MNYYKKDKQLVFKFYDELGASEINTIRKEVIDQINIAKVEVVVFDFSNVTFIDSSAIGFILGRYKQLVALNMNLIIVGINPTIKKILKLSGMMQIITCIDKEEV